MRAGLIMVIVAVLIAASAARMHRPGLGASLLGAEHSHGTAGESARCQHDHHSNVRTHSHGHWHGDVYHVHEHSHHGEGEHWDDDAEHGSQPHDDHVHIRGMNPEEDQRSPMPEMLRQRRDPGSGTELKATFAAAMMGALPEPCIWRPARPPRCRDAPNKAMQRAALTSVILRI